jgi:hypothetical protein
MPTINTITPEEFGAVGNGTTDDQPAFDALNAYLAANNGGRVVMRPGAVYLAGKQTTVGVFYLTGQSILYAQNVAALIVIMNGATIRFKDGLKFGSFDPVTGQPISPALPFIDPTKAASIGTAVLAANVRYFEVRGGVINGNSQGAVIGGFYGDTGRQLVHYGVASYNCQNVVWEDVAVINSCLDGFLCSYTGLTGSSPAHPFAMKRCSADKVARNCLSVIGTNSALIEECEFSRAGQADNNGLGTHFGSSPASCLDVEAEESTCRNIWIKESRLISGAYSNTAFVADSGDSADITLEDSLLVGVAWANKPRIVFSRCRVFGQFGKMLGGSANPQDNTRFADGLYSDSPMFEDTITTANLGIDLQGAGPGVVFENSRIEVQYTRMNLRNGIFSHVDIDFRTGTDKIADQDWVIVMEGAHWDNVVIQENIPAAKEPATAYYVGGPTFASSLLKDCQLVSANQKIRWTSWSPGAAGYVGEFDNHEESARSIALFRKLGWTSGYWGKTRLFASDAAPASGTYVAGDIVLNEAPVPGGHIGWVCVTGGSPGSWKTFGTIAS